MIQVKYEIYGTQKTVPVFMSYDKLQTHVEFNELTRNPKGDFYRLVQTPMPGEEMTKQEEYVLLVYHVRRLIRKYFDNGRKEEDKKESLAQESILDKWNNRTQSYIDTHPGYQPKDKEAHAFFVLVSEWRKTWKERMAYKRRKMGFEQAVLDQMSKKCRALEKQIDEYVKRKLQLL